MVAKLHWKEQTQVLGKIDECKNHPQCKTLEGFWEAHREGDTENGSYDGWIEPREVILQELED